MNVAEKAATAAGGEVRASPSFCWVGFCLLIISINLIAKASLTPGSAVGTFYTAAFGANQLESVHVSRLS